MVYKREIIGIRNKGLGNKAMCCIPFSVNECEHVPKTILTTVIPFTDMSTTVCTVNSAITTDKYSQLRMFFYYTVAHYYTP